MSDTLYNAQSYLRMTSQEISAALVTSVFASFILTFNDWGDETFDLAVGLGNLLIVLVFLFVALLVVVFLCKLFAIRLGYVIEYEPHMLGLLVGLFIGVASAGYLPVFIPGGFRFQRPERLRVGKFLGHYKGWEMGLIAATFPLLMIAWVLVLSPIYLATQLPVLTTLLVASCLFAIYACIPLPGVATGQKGNLLDWFRYLKGSTFGLEVFWNSPAGYIILTFTILIFSALAFVLTLLGTRTGVLAYGASLVLALLTMWVYSRFFKA